MRISLNLESLSYKVRLMVQIKRMKRSEGKTSNNGTNKSKFVKIDPAPRVLYHTFIHILWPVHPFLKVTVPKDPPCGAFQDACGQQQLF